MSEELAGESLSEQTPGSPQRGIVTRYERKFVLPPASLALALRSIQRHSLQFSEIYIERQINNVYADTLNWASFKDNVSGAPTRRKSRFRWYGEVFAPLIRPVLEFKEKQGLVGWKRGFELGTCAFADGSAFPFDPLRARALVAVDAPRLVSHLERTVPVLFNRYRRRYFLSASRAVRLTLDWDLEFSEPHRGGQPPRRFQFQGAVIELKYDGSAEAALREARPDFPYRCTRFSKYVVGVQITRHL